MRRIYIIPNIITAFGLSCGLFVIFKANMLEPKGGTYQLLFTASMLILLAALADWVDGAVARIIRGVSEFGFMFDSLADAVSFGIAPSVLLLKSLSLEQGTGLSFYAIVGCMLYSICGILRLVRFNVKAHQMKNAPKEEAIIHHKHFTGLPIPAAALAAVSINLFFASSFATDWFPAMSETVKTIVLTTIMIILGYFMVSRFKFPSAKMLHMRVPSFHLVFFTVIFALFLLYGILYYFPVAMAAVSWFYILVAWIFAIIRFMAGKKSKTLQEFEPEQEEHDHEE